ncbi:RHS repeat-associated core domain-containing protein [Cytophagaceae bacterium ABcell3]|nr:RHS repeat-associated core domain-containing protein [Cytophagaceae bacterium ABcell3]
MQFPEDVEQERKILLPRYNRSGALEQVGLKNTEASEEQVYVERIAYNARGQRTLIAFGNGMMTRYAYDEDNFRLKRLRTERYEKNGLAYNYASGTVRQDNFYEYDLSGNITSIINRAPGSGVGGTDILEKDYTYDALYRLLSATGRETATTAAEPWDDTYRSHDPTLTRGYTQHYSYDKMGNIQGLQHIATGGNFTRSFTYTENKNILEDITIGQTAYGFIHDVNGNIIREGESRHFAWDYADRLKSFRIQAGEGEPSLNAFYLYDSGGNRIKKLVQKQDGSYKSTTYIDGIFEHSRESSMATGNAIPDLEIGIWTIGVYDQGIAIPDLEIGQWIIGQYGGTVTEQNILHIMDDQSRIATIRIGDAMGDTKPAIKYNLEDHLGSSCIQVDSNGTLVSREEYTPFGETSFGSFGKKRYRFCGKEKDEESGLYYYGMRYYNAWTCRFVSVDPLAGDYPFYTPYQYAGNKPIVANDLDGLEDVNQVENNPDTGSNPQNENNTEGGDDTPIPYASREAFDESNELIEHGWDNLSNYTDEAVQRELNNSDPKISQEAKDILTQRALDAGRTFAKEEIEDLKSLFTENAAKSKKEGRMDCITILNKAVRTVLNDNTLKLHSNGKDGYLIEKGKKTDSRIDITYGKLGELNKASKPKTIDYSFKGSEFTYKGQKPSETSLSMTNGDLGYSIFGLSISGGWHSVTLILDTSDPDNVRYFLSDQNPVYRNENPIGHRSGTGGWREFSASELDQWLLTETHIYSSLSKNNQTTLWRLNK